MKKQDIILVPATTLGGFGYYKITKYTLKPVVNWNHKSIQQSTLLKKVTLMSLLKVGLDYGEEVHSTKNLRGMQQYDWLQNWFFASQGLHYIQDFFRGGLQA